MTIHIFKKIADYKSREIAPNFVYEDRDTITLAKKNNLPQKLFVQNHYINFGKHLVKKINYPPLHKTCTGILGIP